MLPKWRHYLRTGKPEHLQRWHSIRHVLAYLQQLSGFYLHPYFLHLCRHEHHRAPGGLRSGRGTPCPILCKPAILETECKCLITLDTAPLLLWVHHGTFSLDPQSGELSFAANPGNLEVGVLCLQVNEYRNGQLIGQLWRDVQVRVMNCGANTNPTVGALTNNTTGIVAGDTIIIPTAGTSFCVDIPFTDPDTGQSLTAYWDGGIPGASFTQVGFPTVSDTIFGNAPVGRFCWTPPSNGVFNFLVTAEDTECPYPGWEDRLITVIVGNTGIFASAIPQGCNGYLLSVIPGGGVPPYTFSWSGTGGISTNPGANSAVFNHTFPGPGTYSYSVTVTGGGAYNQTISGTIVVPNIPPMNLIGQSGAVDQCRSSTLFLDAPLWVCFLPLVEL